MLSDIRCSLRSAFMRFRFRDLVLEVTLGCERWPGLAFGVENELGYGLVFGTRLTVVDIGLVLVLDFKLVLEVRLS